MARRSCGHVCYRDTSLRMADLPNEIEETATTPMLLDDYIGAGLDGMGGIGPQGQHFENCQAQFQEAQSNRMYTRCCICTSLGGREPIYGGNCEVCRRNQPQYKVEHDRKEAYENRPDVMAWRQQESDNTLAFLQGQEHKQRAEREYRAQQRGTSRDVVIGLKRAEKAINPKEDAAKMKRKIQSGTYKVGEDDWIDRQVEEGKFSDPHLVAMKKDNNAFWATWDEKMRKYQREIRKEMQDTYGEDHQNTLHLFGVNSELKRLMTPSAIMAVQALIHDSPLAYDQSKPGTIADNNVDGYCERWLIKWFFDGCSDSAIRKGFTLPTHLNGVHTKVNAGKVIDADYLRPYIARKVESAKATGAINDGTVNAYLTLLCRGLGMPDPTASGPGGPPLAGGGAFPHHQQLQQPSQHSQPQQDPIATFINITKSTEETAIQYLRSCDFDVRTATDLFFADRGGGQHQQQHSHSVQQYAGASGGGGYSSGYPRAQQRSHGHSSGQTPKHISPKRGSGGNSGGYGEPTSPQQQHRRQPGYSPPQQQQQQQQNRSPPQSPQDPLEAMIGTYRSVGMGGYGC